MDISRNSLAVLIFFSVFLILLLFNFHLGFPPITGDEIWAATSVLGTPFESILFTLRFDLHPPAYYSLMDLWATFGVSDYWLKTSSILTHSLLISSTYWVVTKTSSNRAAWFAASFVAVSPILFQYSTQLRMYSLISLLSLWVYYYSRKISVFHINKADKLKLFAVEIILVYSHAIGILFVFFHYLYGVTNLITIKRYNCVVKWSAIHFLVFLLSIPPIASSLFRSAGHSVAPTVDNILNISSLTILVFPNGVSRISIVFSLSVVICLLLVKRSRILIICYFLLPISCFTLISYLVKPIWLERNFIFTVPMVLISIAVAVDDLINKNPKYQNFAYLIVIIYISSSFIFSLSQRLNTPINNNFSKLSSYLNNTANKNDCIISTNTMNTFWSLLRYGVGEDWGNPMIVQPPLTEKWENIVERLPSSATEFFKLIPKKNYFENKNRIISSGFSDRCRLKNVDNIYVVHEGNDFPYNGNNYTKVKSFGSYYVYKSIVIFN